MKPNYYDVKLNDIIRHFCSIQIDVILDTKEPSAVKAYIDCFKNLVENDMFHVENQVRKMFRDGMTPLLLHSNEIMSRLEKDPDNDRFTVDFTLDDGTYLFSIDSKEMNF